MRRIISPCWRRTRRATATSSSLCRSRISTACITSRASTRRLLAKYSGGLIGMSACLKGEINMHIQADQLPKARQSVADFRDIFGAENFFLEMHNHGIEAQRKCNRVLPKLSREFGVGLVAANDVHFLNREDHEAHDVHDLHRHRLERRRREADALRAGALFQKPRRKCGSCFPSSRRPLRQHAGDRGAVQSGHRVWRAEIPELHAARRQDAEPVSARNRRDRPAETLRRTRGFRGGAETLRTGNRSCSKSRGS